MELQVGSVCRRGHRIEAPTQVRSRSDGKKFCGICAAEYARAHRKANPSNELRSALKKHNLTEADYYRMLSDQDGRCLICREEPDGGKRLSIDHDHGCCPGPRSCGKCVRGLLCGGCNRGIGQFKDDVEKLRAAIRYLEAWELAHA